MVSKIIERYKKRRKYRHLSRKYSHQYAFIGAGNHSLSNLYPVLDYLGVPLKYVVTESARTAEVLNMSPKRYIATNNFSTMAEDESIRGVFISAYPSNHYTLVKQMLAAKKHIFVEKPPCRDIFELERLIELEQEMQSPVVVTGLQKRYAPACDILRPRLKRVEYYTYKYCVGAYLEGKDILTELFIHPIDLVMYLFGDASPRSIVRTRNSLLLHLKHVDGTAGSLELSTAHSWQMAEERLSVVGKSGIYELINMSELLYHKKPPVLGRIPIEKIIKRKPMTETLFNQNMFNPVVQHNNVYVHGFYTELENFVSMCESSNFDNNLSDLTSLRATYQLIDEIRNRKKSYPR
jgi:virulence factor